VRASLGWGMMWQWERGKDASFLQYLIRLPSPPHCSSSSLVHFFTLPYHSCSYSLHYLLLTLPSPSFLHLPLLLLLPNLPLPPPRSPYLSLRGVSLTIQGYSPKLSVLAEKVFRDFGDSAFWGSVEPALVDLCKERMLRSLKSCKI
jgi:hypothetical protein